jgi:hypothetical protein
MSSKERQPGFIERSSLTLKRAIGAIALVGLALGAPLVSETAIGAGLVWAGADISQKSAKKHRLERDRN